MVVSLSFHRRQLGQVQLGPPAFGCHLKAWAHVHLGMFDPRPLLIQGRTWGFRTGLQLTWRGALLPRGIKTRPLWVQTERVDGVGEDPVCWVAPALILALRQGYFPSKNGISQGAVQHLLDLSHYIKNSTIMVVHAHNASRAGGRRIRGSKHRAVYATRLKTSLVYMRTYLKKKHFLRDREIKEG